MMPAVALASGGGRAAPAGHPPRPAAAGHPARAAVAAGVISTLAGSVGGPGPARRVALPDPCGLAVAAGNLYVADRGSVRKVSGAGFLTTPPAPEPSASSAMAARRSGPRSGRAGSPWITPATW